MNIYLTDILSPKIEDNLEISMLLRFNIILNVMIKVSVRVQVKIRILILSVDVLPLMTF